MDVWTYLLTYGFNLIINLSDQLMITIVKTKLQKLNNYISEMVRRWVTEKLQNNHKRR